MIKSPRFSEKSLSFLVKAGKQKRPDWLDKNREEYEELIVQPLSHVARHVKLALGSLAPDYNFPQKGLGRLRRSANRIRENGGSLFKNWLSYSAARPRESRFTHNPNLFLLLNPTDKDDKVLVAGGLYMPSSPQTRALREAIAVDATPFEKLFASKDFAKHFPGGFSDERISSRLTRGYDPNHPKMHWLRLQAFFVWKPYTMKQFTSKNFSEIVTADFKQILRLNRLLENREKPVRKEKPSSSLLERLDRIEKVRHPMDF